MPRTKRKKPKQSRRIDWSMVDNLDCVNLVNHGLHGDTIARATGLSRGQVYYRAKCVGVRLRNYRDGKGPVAAVLLRRFTVKEVREETSEFVEKRLKKNKKK